MNITVAAPTTDELLAMAGISPAACDAALHQFYARRHGREVRGGGNRMSNQMRQLLTQFPSHELYGRAVDSVVAMQAEINMLEAERNPIVSDLALVGDGMYHGEHISMF